jgi:hypothetical protein
MADASGVCCRLRDAQWICRAPRLPIGDIQALPFLPMTWNDNFTVLSIWNIHSILKSCGNQDVLVAFPSKASD